MKHARNAALALAAVLFGVLLGVTSARAATPGCGAIPNGGCSSWQTPGGGGLDLDVYRQLTAADTPLIVYTATSSDPAEDFEVVPVPAGAVSVYTYAGSQVPTTQAFVNIEYAPLGRPSGMCVSDIDPVANEVAELRPCNLVAGRYNPFQSFIMLAADVADGTFDSFQDAPVSLEGTATGLYLSDELPQLGAGTVRRRIDVVSEPEGGAGLTGAQLWAAIG